MRDKDVIISDIKNNNIDLNQRLIIEVLLDIRELNKEILRLTINCP